MWTVLKVTEMKTRENKIQSQGKRFLGGTRDRRNVCLHSARGVVDQGGAAGAPRLLMSRVSSVLSHFLRPK